MNRLLTILSVAIGFAASCSPSAFAGPSEDALPVDNAVGTSLPAGRSDASSPTLLRGNSLTQPSWHTSFAEIEFDRLPAVSISTSLEPLAGAHDGPGVEGLNDFISPSWLRADAKVESFSRLSADAQFLRLSEPIQGASSDVNTLSVPEIPLPSNIIPGITGVIAVWYIHKRSLKHSKLPK